MKRLLCTAALLGALISPLAAQADTGEDNAPVGKAAGTLLVRARVIGVIPTDQNSSITAVGGQVNTTAQIAPEVDFSYFFTDNIAAELIAATTRHEVSGAGTALGKVDVGSTWVLPPTLTLQYHFAPHSAFSPYVGAGLNWSLFYGGHPATPVVKSYSLENNFAPAVQIGCDYNFSGHWFANLDAKMIFLDTTARINTVLGPISAKTSLDPLVVGAGVGYRF